MKSKPYIPREYTHIDIVGVGGTGSYLAEGLAKMIAGYNLPTEVFLIDPDLVESKNCSRQNFHEYEIGYRKAEVLALRINQRYGLAFGSSTLEGQQAITKEYSNRLIVTCVDSLKARKHFYDKGAWLDMGNGKTKGQAIFGTTAMEDELAEDKDHWDERPTVLCVPNAYAMVGMGELEEDKSIPSCADHPFTEQGVFVNEWAAHAGLVILYQLLVDKVLTTHRVYFDSAKGQVNSGNIVKESYLCP